MDPTSLFWKYWMHYDDTGLAATGTGSDVGDVIIESLTNLRDTLASGVPLEDRYKVTAYGDVTEGQR